MERLRVLVYTFQEEFAVLTDTVDASVFICFSVLLMGGWRPLKNQEDEKKKEEES